MSGASMKLHVFNSVYAIMNVGFI